MRVRVFVVRLVLLVACLSCLTSAGEDEHTPQLLLSPKLLRRLKRDRERQTVRWLNFEKRVQTVPDSPERGFELALYYVVTRDGQRGREAVAWALAHKSEARQAALVDDWAADLISPEQQRALEPPSTAGNTPPERAAALRDRLFSAITDRTLDHTPLDSYNKQLLEQLTKGGATDPDTLYAAVEYLMAVRSSRREDLRETEPQFFSRLPREFLLSMRPAQVEHPTWTAHIAALALVTLDPNLENSQFLQGWALEDRQMLRDGPGVAYEFLWADPYLPGIAYQNMDPWSYDPAGRLFARRSWEVDSCWIRVTKQGRDEENCGPSLATQPLQIGTLTLIPLTSSCANIPNRTNRDAAIVWNLKPEAQLPYESGGQRNHGQADAAGMWLVPADTAGRVCVQGRAKR